MTASDIRFCCTGGAPASVAHAEARLQQLGFETPNLYPTDLAGALQLYQQYAASKRAALIEQAQVIFKRERPWMPMAHSSVYIPMRRDVRGFVMSPNGSMDFEGVTRE